MFLITGGGSGIGRALALALTKRKHPVLIVGRREAMLEETAACSPLIKTLNADVSTAEGLEVIAQYCADIPRIDALINNAGTLDPILPLTKITPDVWHKVFRTNVDPALFLPQMLYEQLTDGRVLNIGTGAAYYPAVGWACYSTSKAATAMLTKCWELESQTISFANVLPGIANTDMQAIARSAIHMEPDKVEFFRRLKEHGRLISPDTVAEFLCWLLLGTDHSTFASKLWDIYDTSHHSEWLNPPHQVLHWNF